MFKQITMRLIHRSSWKQFECFISKNCNNTYFLDFYFVFIVGNDFLRSEFHKDLMFDTLCKIVAPSLKKIIV